MLKEIDFYRLVADDSNINIALFRSGFKNAISQLVRENLKQENYESQTDRLIIADLVAVCISYSYIDWLTGEFGDIPINKVTEITKKMLPYSYF